jgi:hypothetical protein
MEQIKNNIRKFKIHNEDSLKQYFDLLENNVLNENEYFEKHHILPRSMFPEFVLDDWNIIKLSYPNHQLAHKLLYEIYQNDSMKAAYLLMHNIKINVATLPEIKEKISKSKTGKPRLDMKGKKYFGANAEKIIAGNKKMSEKLKGTVIVKDTNGNKFRVSVNDPRYLSGELVPFSLGEKRPNSGTKNPKVLNDVLQKREETYNKICSYSYEKFVEYLTEEYKNGKTIFTKKYNIHANYTKLIRKTNFTISDIKNSVVQRLEKDGIEIPNQVS